MRAPARTSARIAAIHDQMNEDDNTQDSFASPRNIKPHKRYRNVKDTCEVCEEESTGFRYGARTCNACGQFFLKCSGKTDIPPCENEEKCVLTFEKRNSCRYCRFQKCLAVGMTEDVDCRLRKRRYSEHDDSSGPEWDLYPLDESSSSSSNDLVEASPTNTVPDEEKGVVCAVCGAESVGKRYGAEACNACADFFFKFGKNPDPRRYKRNCITDGKCVINIDTRADCPFCRVKKCLAVGMAPKTNGGVIVLKQRPTPVSIDKSDDLCVICGDDAIGLRYGVRACRPCEEFYHRIISKDPDTVCPTLECVKGEEECHINSMNRSDCRYCRFKKCLEVGMVSNSAPMSQFFKFFEARGGFGKFEVPIEEDNDIPMYFIDNIQIPTVPAENFCTVCGAPSVGRRWGVETCDPCSQFFYVTWPNRHTVQCKTGMQQCVITLGTRYHCRYCRMQKCIAVGMDSSGFGTRSSPKKQRSEDAVLVRSSTVDWGNNEASNLSLDDSSPGSSTPSSSNSSFGPSGTGYGFSNTKLETIIRCHKDSCAFTMEKVQRMVDEPLDFINIPNAQYIEVWRFFAPQMDLEIRQILSFLHHIDIGTTRNSTFKIFLLRITRALTSEGLFLQDGRFIDIQILNVLFGELLAKNMLQVVNSIRTLGLTDDDIALFIVLVHLESTPKSGVPCPPERLVNELQMALEAHVPDFHTLMGLMKKLEEINNTFQGPIVQFLFNHRQYLQLPQVLSEVFEIPTVVLTPNLL